MRGVIAVVFFCLAMTAVAKETKAKKKTGKPCVGNFVLDKSEVILDKTGTLVMKSTAKTMTCKPAEIKKGARYLACENGAKPEIEYAKDCSFVIVGRQTFTKKK